MDYRNLAQGAREQAEREFQSSEYPRLGRAAYTGLSDAYQELAEALEAEPTSPKADNAYEAKRARRIDRLKAKAARLRVEAAQADCRSHDVGRNIPFGQPILVGHHSERRHRNAIEKMHRANERGRELRQAAADAEHTAKAAAKNHAISSDDPQAVSKLQAKLAALEGERDLMKKANVLAKKGDSEGLETLGFSDQQIHRLLNPKYFYERPGFQNWEISNLGAEIRRLKKRVDELSAETPESDRVKFESENFEVFEDDSENRICFKFPGKPDEKTRSELKSRGFKWSPSRGLWVRQLDSSARWAAKHAINELTKGV